MREQLPSAVAQLRDHRPLHLSHPQIMAHMNVPAPPLGAPGAREVRGRRVTVGGSRWRDVAVAASGGGAELLINIDLDPPTAGSAVTAGLAMGCVEEARADLADETNLNARLVRGCS